MAEITWKETRYMKVPLTAEEIQARGELLAKTLGERTEMIISHNAEKKRMSNAEQALDSKIASLGRVVRDRVEERAVQVELRINLGLGMVEVVRTDTGELVEQRHATPDDKLRAQVEAQTDLPGVDKPKDPA